MWILVLITLINSVLNQYTFQNVNRLRLGVLQFGIQEAMIFLGLFVALIRGGNQRARFPTPNHPVLFWIMLFLSIGWVFGVIGSIMVDAPLKFALASAREFGAIPICIFVGYRMLGTPSNGRSMAMLWAVAGCLTASMLLASFGQKTEAASLAGTLNPIRGIIIDYDPEYALIGALVLLYSIVTNTKLLPTPLALGMSIFCFAGYAAPLSRTSLVEISTGLLGCYFILPREKRMGKVGKAILLGPVVGGAMWMGLVAADAVIGRDFASKVQKHFMTMLPGERDGNQTKAWETRTPAIIIELGLWMQNPLMGQGFSSQEALMWEGKISTAGYGYNHNVWSSTLCKTGIIGFAGAATLVGAMIVLGRRMVRDALDHSDVLMGALGYVGGVALLVRGSCTMAFTSRAALAFGIICGTLIRAREMQLARRAMATEYEQADVDATELLPYPAPPPRWGYTN